MADHTLTTFTPFARLPIEIRLLIWDSALEEHASDNIVYYHDGDPTWDFCEIIPTRNLVCPLLAATWESRNYGLRWFDAKLDVQPVEHTPYFDFLRRGTDQEDVSETRTRAGHLFLRLDKHVFLVGDRLQEVPDLTMSSLMVMTHHRPDPAIWGGKTYYRSVMHSDLRSRVRRVFYAGLRCGVNPNSDNHVPLRRLMGTSDFPMVMEEFPGMSMLCYTSAFENMHIILGTTSTTYEEAQKEFRRAWTTLLWMLHNHGFKKTEACELYFRNSLNPPRRNHNPVPAQASTTTRQPSSDFFHLQPQGHHARLPLDVASDKFPWLCNMSCTDGRKPSASLESSQELTHSPSKPPMPTPNFPKFPDLPPELQIQIWEEALKEEAGRRIIYIDRPYWAIRPTKNLCSPLLATCVESRKLALARYTTKRPVLRVYEKNAIADRRIAPVRAGILYLRPSDDFPVCNLRAFEMGKELAFLGGLGFLYHFCESSVMGPENFPMSSA
ncbi:putative 2EXR domain-containing protein [Seiridium cardinale]|uniref:2EXR domain-containing protein n=1 Tax=Seiridium cardinale TaxID=138064 RepID=A0ABR2XHN7_9PEZI